MGHLFGGGGAGGEELKDVPKRHKLGSSAGGDDLDSVTDDGAEAVSPAGTYQCIVKARPRAPHSTHERVRRPRLRAWGRQAGGGA